MADLLPDSESLRVAGRLSADGVDLGDVRRIEFLPFESVRPIIDEAFGGEARDLIIRNESPIVLAVLGGISNAIVDRLFAKSSAGATASKGGYPEALGASGRLASASEFKLLFTPEDTDHPGLVVYRASLHWDAVTAFRFMITEEIGAPVVFSAFRDGVKGTYEMARIADITL